MQFRLLLSTQRSGSHFLKSFIEARFPDVTCSGEVLEEPVESQSPVLSGHPEIARFWTWYMQEVVSRNVSAAPGQRLAAFETYLTKMIDAAAPNDLVIDVKYNCVRSLSGYEDTDHGSTHFTNFIKSHRIPVLHLVRKNGLKIIISHQLARKTGVWHRTNETASTEDLPKMRLNPKLILRAISQSERLTQDYREHFENYPGYEEVVYEDLIREEEQAESSATVQTLSRFLESAPRDFDPSAIWCKKTTPDDPSKVIENWDEIVRQLQPTEYAWMAQTPLLAAA